MDVWFCSRAGINGREATDALRHILIRSMRARLSAPRDTCAFPLTLTYMEVAYSVENDPLPIGTRSSNGGGVRRSDLDVVAELAKLFG